MRSQKAQISLKLRLATGLCPDLQRSPGPLSCIGEGNGIRVGGRKGEEKEGNGWKERGGRRGKEKGGEGKEKWLEEREKGRKKGKDSIPLTNILDQPLYWQEARSSIVSVRKPLNWCCYRNCCVVGYCGDRLLADAVGAGDDDAFIALQRYSNIISYDQQHGMKH